MLIDGQPYRSIWRDMAGTVNIIDQTLLPHGFRVIPLEDMPAAAYAIQAMQVRGAPLIGATAAYGLAIAMEADASDSSLINAITTLSATRPTAINLHWALDRVSTVVRTLPEEARAAAAMVEADAIAEEDIAINAAIGGYGLAVIQAIADTKPPGATINILTHCNAGWIATVDWGTALAPIYKAHDAGILVHVWVDETRPRNQGAALTAWELGAHGVPHHVIVDNAGGHLMQNGLVDLCITGTDRTTANGDVCNKIGTYLKALAAQDNGVPFYVALPTPSIDWTINDGIAEIPIEQRAPGEVTHINGVTDSGRQARVRITPAASPARNDAFDVTPARLVTGLITERGVVEASTHGLAKLRLLAE